MFSFFLSCFKETVIAHSVTILSEMASALDEEYHKYHSEMVDYRTSSRFIYPFSCPFYLEYPGPWHKFNRKTMVKRKASNFFQFPTYWLFFQILKRERVCFWSEMIAYVNPPTDLRKKMSDF